MKPGNSAEVFELSHKLEEKMEWRKWDEKIPYLTPKKYWDIKARPPFNRAVIRYHVKDRLSGRRISIYLDCYEHLGMYGYGDEPTPYWEMYPYTYPRSNGRDDEDVKRVAMKDVGELEELIEEEFNNHRNFLQRILAKVWN